MQQEGQFTEVLSSEGQWLIHGVGGVLVRVWTPGAAWSVSCLGQAEKFQCIFIDSWPLVLSSNAKHSFIHSFSDYLLNASFVPGTRLDSKDTQ